jgi:hypothetical protein
MSQLTVNEFKQHLLNPLTEVFGASIKIGEITSFFQTKGLMDETVKLMVKDSNGHNIAVVLCSSPVSPKLVARGAKNSHLAKHMLNPVLGNHILTPLYEGDFQGLSYTITRYCMPLSSNRAIWYFERALLSPLLFKWLAMITRATVTQLNSSQIETEFVIPLHHLIELDGMTDGIRSRAKQALDRIERGQWQPCQLLMHGDLWAGNILLDINNRDTFHIIPPFKIIDWAGSLIQGYAMYDLLRLGLSLKLTTTQMHQQIASHCQILNCDLVDASSHLLSALAYMSMNLEYFPLHRFVTTADSCVAALERAGV